MSVPNGFPFNPRSRDTDSVDGPLQPCVEPSLIRVASGFVRLPVRFLGVARWSSTSLWSSWARGLAQLHVHAHRHVPAQPPFSWPPNGRALVAATWHGHPRPCACGVAHALDKGSGRPLASGMGRSARHTAVLGLPAPPSGPHFRLTNTRRCRAISDPVRHVAAPCCSRHTGTARRGAGGDLGFI